MTFHIASDLHQEFDKDDGLVARADNLILAGDIVPFCSLVNLHDTYRKLSKKFKKIIHVPGNHEYYSRTPRSMRALLYDARKIADRYDVTILNNQTLDIDQVRLFGSTLWSHVPDECAETVSEEMNDYQCIHTERGLLTVMDTNTLHAEACLFIKEAVKIAIAEHKIPVVVTHHAPQIEGTCAPQYVKSARNTAFVTDLRDLYPGVHTWIFGHTHWSCDMIDPDTRTRIVSNPRGYPGERIMFRRNFVLEF